MRHRTTRLAAAVAAASLLLTVPGATASSPEAPMLEGFGPWTAQALFTVGETVGGYTPPGVLDGLAAYDTDGPEGDAFRVLANHELEVGEGYGYTLADGTMLTGSRISYFDFDGRDATAAGLAYDTIHDRSGAVVTDADQIGGGLDRFCSAVGYFGDEAVAHGFVDDVYLTGEETDDGTVWALDVANRELWAAPALGRGSWENVTALAPPADGYVALLLGDDSEAAPLYLYVGRKDVGGDFLARNGLAEGRLFALEVEHASSPEDFNGTGNAADGRFVPVQVRDASKAGQPGYDDEGYLDQATLTAAAHANKAFMFSRPEDLDANPYRGNEAVFASTGRGSRFPSDDWGTLYRVVVDPKGKFDGDRFGRDLERGKKARHIDAELRIVLDADDSGDFGVRSPDNLTWSPDGLLYVQEDRSVSNATFGGTSGFEASVWQVDPATGAYNRIGVIDRSAVPADQRDTDPDDLGDWETSGVIDVSALFGAAPGSMLLLDVQAHSVRFGPDDADPRNEELVQGGQLVLLTR